MASVVKDAVAVVAVSEEVVAKVVVAVAVLVKVAVLAVKPQLKPNDQFSCLH